jgi:hypothetical protein
MNRYYINQKWIDSEGENVIFSFEVPDKATYDRIMREIITCKNRGCIEATITSV